MVWFSTAFTCAALALQAGGYSDIPSGHWAAKSVGNLVTAKLLPEGGGNAFQGEKPVTRYEFAVLMDRFVTDIRRMFVRQPASKTINETKIAGRSDDGSKAAMVRLAKEGFLPYESPIFRGPAETLTPEMMSIALTQIAGRIGWCMRHKDDD